MRIKCSFWILWLFLAYTRADEFCGVLGPLSGVVCITETQYKTNLADPYIYECLRGFCVNSEEICVEDAEPSCKLSKQCASCEGGVTSVCVAQKMYASCVDGVLGSNKYCQASRPYCAMRVGEDGIPQSVCTNIIQQALCNGTPTDTTTVVPPKPTDPVTTPRPDPGDDENCLRLGKFPVKSDPTCKTYVYCYPDKDRDGNDQIGKMIYTCPGTSVYDPQSLKCINGTHFTCTNG